MKKSYNCRAEREVEWRKRRRQAISTVAKFAGLPHILVASDLSKRIDGGRRFVFEKGEHVGYA